MSSAAAVPRAFFGAFFGASGVRVVEGLVAGVLVAGALGCDPNASNDPGDGGTNLDAAPLGVLADVAWDLVVELDDACSIERARPPEPVATLVFAPCGAGDPRPACLELLPPAARDFPRLRTPIERDGARQPFLFEPSFAHPTVALWAIGDFGAGVVDVFRTCPGARLAHGHDGVAVAWGSRVARFGHDGHVLLSPVDVGDTPRTLVPLPDGVAVRLSTTVATVTPRGTHTSRPFEDWALGSVHAPLADGVVFDEFTEASYTTLWLTSPSYGDVALVSRWRARIVSVSAVGDLLVWSETHGPDEAWWDPVRVSAHKLVVARFIGGSAPGLEVLAERVLFARANTPWFVAPPRLWTGAEPSVLFDLDDLGGPPVADLEPPGAAYPVRWPLRAAEGDVVVVGLASHGGFVAVRVE